MSALSRIPTQGCIIEFMEGNAVNIAYVLEESSGKLRLLLPGRRELKLSSSRVLPWIGPSRPLPSREEITHALEEAKDRREKKAQRIDLVELWDLTHEEMKEAPASWFAELMETDPDADTVAAYGRALLNCKSHFRFQGPNFQIFDAGTVEKRLEAQKNREAREALVSGGAAFLRMLWEVASRKRTLAQALAASDSELDPEVGGRLERMLFARMLNPESQEDDVLWQLMRKGLPEVPHLPFQLLVAWEKLPKHHNFWMDRADYEPGDDWWKDCAVQVETLKEKKDELAESCALPFISIDSGKTRDIDDAFHIAPRGGGGWTLTVALACPALHWPFGEALDKKVLRRGTSLYLPEGDHHMLPEILGLEKYSLHAGQKRPAFCLRMEVDANGDLISSEPFASEVRLAANLNYDDVQALLENEAIENAASPYARELKLAADFARAREARRVENGAVVMIRPEPSLSLMPDGDDFLVELIEEPLNREAMRLVSETMVIASAAVANWAFERNLPLLHRTQNVAIPREYAGIWSNPEDLAKIMRVLIPSSLEITPHPHAALAVPRYAPITSPLRRYADLINEAQVLHFLEHGKARWEAGSLGEMLDNLAPCLDAASHVQRFRPRYWKLLYFRQRGDKAWWDGVITEENENFVNVSLPRESIILRDRRNLFDERACPGQHVRLRLGKINPLYNEIRIIETVPAE